MKEIISLLKDLIRFKSMHIAPHEINQCMDFICDWLEKRDLPVKRIDHYGTPSVISLPQRDRVPVLLMSHIDVVDGSHELFEPIEKEGNLYGRGAVDDKYAAALSMVLMDRFANRLREEGRSLSDLPLGILITGDEEIGGSYGAKRALKGIEADFAIALDGGNPDKIVTKEKGILRLKLTAEGKAAHGARPWLGENAIENLMADYGKIRPFFADQSAPQHWHRTLNLGTIRGGKSVNQVPDRAEAMLDIRYTENDDIDRLIADIREVISGEIEVEEREPLFISDPSPYLDLLLETAKAQGLETVTGVEHGASDARFLSDYGINGVVWGAESEMSQHTPEEHLVIDSLEKVYHTMEAFLQRVESIDGKRRKE